MPRRRAPAFPASEPLCPRGHRLRVRSTVVPCLTADVFPGSLSSTDSPCWAPSGPASLPPKKVPEPASLRAWGPVRVELGRNCLRPRNPAGKPRNRRAPTCCPSRRPGVKSWIGRESPWRRPGSVTTWGFRFQRRISSRSAGRWNMFVRRQLRLVRCWGGVFRCPRQGWRGIT